MSRGKSKLHLFFTLTIERKCPPRMNIIVIQIHPAADLWQSVRHAGRSNMGGGSLKIVFGKTIDLAVMIVKRDFHREVVQMIYARPLRPADARRIQNIQCLFGAVLRILGKKIGDRIETIAFSGCLRHKARNSCRRAIKSPSYGILFPRRTCCWAAIPQRRRHLSRPWWRRAVQGAYMEHIRIVMSDQV